MKWYRINDYAITNGQEFSGLGYKHGTHIISKELVSGEPRYTLWDGDRMVQIFKTPQEAKSMAEREVESAI